MIQFHAMKVYYIAYNYYNNGMEMIDGPFGTFSEAQSERDRMIGTNVDDPNLVIVTEHKEVMIT